MHSGFLKAVTSVFILFIIVGLNICPAIADESGQFDPDKQAMLIRRLGALPVPPSYPSLLLKLESTDSRERWLAARDLGQSGRIEAAPYLMKRLADRNIEVRRRSREALIALAKGNPEAYKSLFGSWLKNQAPLESILARAVNYEISGKTEAARKQYAEAFKKDSRLYWAAFHAYDTPDLLARIQEQLISDLTKLFDVLYDNLKNPKPQYPQSLLREAYGLSVLTNSLGKRLGREALKMLDEGRNEEALALRDYSAELMDAGGNLSGLAKTFELKLRSHIKQFEFSDADAGAAREAAMIQVRSDAALKLGSYNTEAAIRALTNSLRKDPSADVRKSCAMALASFCNPETSSTLYNAFSIEKSTEVRQEIIKALGCKPDKKALALIYGLVNKKEYTEAAITALGRSGSDKDLDFLRKSANNPKFYTSSDENLGIKTVDSESILLTIAQALETIAENRSGSEAAKILQDADTVRKRAMEFYPAPQVGGAPPKIVDLDNRPQKSSGKASRKYKKPGIKTGAAPVLTNQKKEIKNIIDAWIKAWEKKDLEAFIGFYDPGFRFRDMDLKAYKKYKIDTFRKYSRISVTASNLEIDVKGDKAEAVFMQVFRADQYKDYGLKRLVFTSRGGHWRIISESWQKLDNIK